LEATLAREFIKHPSKLVRILSDEKLLNKLTPLLNLEAKRLLCRAAGVPCTVIDAIALFIACNLSHLSYITMARRFYLPSLPTILSRMAVIAGPIIPIYSQGQEDQEPEEVELEDEDEDGEAEALENPSLPQLIRQSLARPKRRSRSRLLS
jgi:hypothetical protein